MSSHGGIGLVQVVKADDNKWHLDKRVQISVIFALALQTLTIIAVGATWKENVSLRIQNLEVSDEKLDVALKHLRDQIDNQDKRTVIIEQAIPRIDSTLTRIETLIRQDQPNRNRFLQESP